MLRYVTNVLTRHSLERIYLSTYLWFSQKYFLLWAQKISPLHFSTSRTKPSIPCSSQCAIPQQVWLLGAVLCPRVDGRPIAWRGPTCWEMSPGDGLHSPSHPQHTLQPRVPWPRTPWGHQPSHKCYSWAIPVTGGAWQHHKNKTAVLRGERGTPSSWGCPQPSSSSVLMGLPRPILWVQWLPFSFSMCWLNSAVVADGEEITWSWEESESVKGKSVSQPLG